MSKLKPIKKLAVWQQATRLSETIFSLSGAFPITELFGLTAQLRRVSAFTAVNIAEGAGEDMCRYVAGLYRASAGLSELKLLITLAGKLKYVRGEELLQARQELRELDRIVKASIRAFKQN